jgi:hypothetical protein
MIEVDIATADDLRWICELESEHYGPYQAAAHARLIEWHTANPYAFLIIRNDGQRSGHLTLLPLRPPMLQALATGERNEGHITAADLYPPEERLQIRDLYVESLIAEPMHLLGEVVSRFEHHVERLADVYLLENVYASPMTPSGRLLIANLGFSAADEQDDSTGRRMVRVNFRDLAERTALLRAALNRRRPG